MLVRKSFLNKNGMSFSRLLFGMINNLSSISRHPYFGFLNVISLIFSLFCIKRYPFFEFFHGHVFIAYNRSLKLQNTI